MDIPRTGKMTHRREVILEELRQLESHPTVEDVFMCVRRRLPKISMATIYRHLEVLSQMGVIRKLESRGVQRRFDATADQHYHIRCTRCERVDDVPWEPVVELEQALHDRCHYQVTGHWIEFSGICPECQADA